MLLQERRSELIEAAKQIQKEKLAPLVLGCFSLRDKETGYICITPSDELYEHLNPEDIVVVDMDGNHVDGERTPSVEKDLHCALFKKRSDIGAVVHTHSIYVAQKTCDNDIPNIVADVTALVQGTIKRAPYYPCSSHELIEMTVNWLKTDDAVLMENHGILVVGDTIQRAFVNAIMVEEVAKVAFYAE